MKGVTYGESAKILISAGYLFSLNVLRGLLALPLKIFRRGFQHERVNPLKIHVWSHLSEGRATSEQTSVQRILSNPRESPPYDRTNRASTRPKVASGMARMSWHAYAQPLKDEAQNQWRVTASSSTKASRRYTIMAERRRKGKKGHPSARSLIPGNRAAAIPDEATLWPIAEIPKCTDA